MTFAQFALNTIITFAQNLITLVIPAGIVVYYSIRFAHKANRDGDELAAYRKDKAAAKSNLKAVNE
jgi:hypothetical protein